MYGRFLPLFYKAHGQSDGSIGLIVVSYYAPSIFTTPLFCNLADRLQRRELVIGLTFGFSSLLFFAQVIALPQLDLITDRARFFVLFTLRALSGVLMSPSFPLVSALAIEQLNNECGIDGHMKFGEERLWGAVSWALCNFALGALLDIPNIHVWVVHIGQLLFSALFLFLLVIFTWQKSNEDDGNFEERSPLIASAAIDEETDTTFAHVEGARTSPAQVSVLSFSFQIVHEGGVATLLFFIMLFWLLSGMSLVENLLFLFFRDDLKASNLLCGVSVVITILFEVPVFALAPFFLQTYGAEKLSVLGSLAYVIRGFGYSISPSGMFALMFEPLHGVTVGAVESSAVSYISERSTKELEATAQSLLKVLWAFSELLGTSTGGYIMQILGSRILYGGAGFLVFCATLLFAVAAARSEASKSATISDGQSFC